MLDRNMWNVDVFLILHELTNHKMKNLLQIPEEINQAYSVTEKSIDYNINKGDF